MRLSLIAAVLFVGCGPGGADFAGRYTGQLTQDDTPCKGQFGKRADAFIWVLTATVAGVSLKNEPDLFGCPTVAFSVAGQVATANQPKCDSAAVVATIGGALTLKGDDLNVDLKTHYSFKPPDAFECDFALAGTLRRDK